MKHLTLVALTLLASTLPVEAKSKKNKGKKNKHTHTEIQQPPSQPLQNTTPPPVQKSFPKGIEAITMDAETVLAFVQKYLPTNPTIVEAGSYDGKDTKKMADLWPYGKIYAFEPVPENFINLEKNTLGNANVKRFPLALSDQNGVADFFNSAYINSPNIPSQSGSLLSPKEHLTYDHGVIFNKVTSVPTVTLDYWAEQNDIDHIDLLWLDMQGYELNMIKNSPNILKTVKVIYTEVEFVEAYQGQYQYKDVKEFLESQGFALVAQDFEEPSTYWFGNAVFVRK